LPVNISMEIGKCGTQRVVKSSRAGLVGSHVRLRSVIHEVLGEEFLEYLEVPAALDFLCISADNSFASLLFMTSSFRVWAHRDGVECFVEVFLRDLAQLGEFAAAGVDGVSGTRTKLLDRTFSVNRVDSVQVDCEPLCYLRTPNWPSMKSLQSTLERTVFRARVRRKHDGHASSPFLTRPR
jgi:hypothetical protein